MPADAPPTVAAARDFSNVPRQPGAAKPDPILVADGVVRRFGGLTAVDVAHLEIQRGSITALIGPNGAGKTTFFNLLTGFDRPDAGNWQFNGQPLAGVAPHLVARRGMVRTFQLTKALSRLTVLDNMRLGATGQRGERFWPGLIPAVWRDQERLITERAEELLVRFKLDAKRGDFAGSLSGGQRKLLEMARALMVGPEMVMLDEPMAGVNPALTQSLLGHVKGLRDDGMTVLFVEHDMDMVRDISDWVVVMGQGRVIAEGTPDEVMADERVIDAYLGAHHDGAAATGDAPEVAEAAVDGEPAETGPADVDGAPRSAPTAEDPAGERRSEGEAKA
ncbi:ABC transporter ATP-binding protein [Rhizomonospora bruguierae]|uniref:ABC transporter ATP-binding protein n=1 Tax=Rhizomonospora bruguierae TaxID=1581705 RepID=UPI001BCB20B8|nr:ABC transporter ATP-binding protein [Micromonospora sp. NBRC 107566]